jgi:hypothetical protein
MSLFVTTILITVTRPMFTLSWGFDADPLCCCVPSCQAPVTVSTVRHVLVTRQIDVGNGMLLMAGVVDPIAVT